MRVVGMGTLEEGEEEEEEEVCRMRMRCRRDWMLLEEASVWPAAIITYRRAESTSPVPA